MDENVPLDGQKRKAKKGCKSVPVCSVLIRINSCISCALLNLYMICDDRCHGVNLNSYKDVLILIDTCVNEHGPMYTNHSW